ncbi:MAG: Ig-like domain-containing protein [Rubrivirga sp.]
MNECDRPPPPEVTWSSSEPTVATISDDGVIEAVTPGHAVISARSGPAQARWSIAVEP